MGDGPLENNKVYPAAVRRMKGKMIGIQVESCSNLSEGKSQDRIVHKAERTLISAN